MTGTQDSPRIVVGVDGSASSAEALRWAMRQARLTGARIDAVAAWEMQPVFGWALAVPDEGAEDRVRVALAKCVADAQEGTSEGLDIQQHVVHGPAATVLPEFGDGAELLVVGTRGYGPLAEALLGSVGQHCVHRARCPVVIVHDPPTENSERQGAAES